MKEELLQFIWEHQLIKKDNLFTCNDEPIEIIRHGIRNINSGPDFIDAYIKIGKQIWAGTVEIHVKSSDWNKHKHSIDRAYDNVILHVVAEHDEEICRLNGQIIPAFILEINNKLFDNYMKLITNKNFVACSEYLGDIDVFYFKYWLNRLIVNRLYRKSNELLVDLEKNNNSWEETFYQLLARNFGFKINTLPFDLLSKSLPLKYIAKQKDNFTRLEALFFGQAGFLNIDCDDSYFLVLKREYLFLQKKYSLVPLKKHLWKFMRMRPLNFPTLRISQFAAILHKHDNLMSKIIDVKNVDDIKSFFKVEVSDYWKTHYNFCSESTEQSKHIGSNSINLILINSIVTFLFAYGIDKEIDIYKTKAIELLEILKPEKNNIITKWSGGGISPKNALESQAMIELYNTYCKKGRCVGCNIGAKIIINEFY